MVNLGPKLNTKIQTKTIQKEYYSCSAQKPDRKSTKCSRNETILKIGHLAKAIAFANGQSGSKIKMPKTCENLFHKNITVVLCKKNRSKKH